MRAIRSTGLRIRLSLLKTGGRARSTVHVMVIGSSFQGQAEQEERMGGDRLVPRLGEFGAYRQEAVIISFCTFGDQAMALPGPVAHG